VDQKNQLVIGPQPDNTYTITGDFMRSAQILAADADTPEMPTQYHMLIAYLAMEKYGYSEAAGEVLLASQKASTRMRRQLEMNQSPAIGWASPLA
jgi:hypothetical protein